MPIKLLFLSFFLFFINLPAWADLNGTLEDNGDGTYTVQVDNHMGDQFTGLAIPQRDGTLKIEIHDHNDHYYSGMGISRSREAYGVNFQNDVTGHLVDGVIVMQ